MITLLEGLGMRAYVTILKSFSHCDLLISIRLTTLVKASEDIFIVTLAEEHTQLLKIVDYWVLHAYITGLSRFAGFRSGLPVQDDIIYDVLHKEKTAGETELVEEDNH
jgi:hypothetical protein